MAKKKYVSQELENFGLDFINKLKPAKWRYEAPLNDGRDHFGFIAQDVMKIVNKEDFNFVTMRENYFSINYWEFIGPMCKAIQEQSKIIQELSEKVKRLENEIRERSRKDKKIDKKEKSHWWNPIN